MINRVFCLFLTLVPAPVLAGQTAIAVLPFDNISKDQEIAWFEDGAAKAMSVECAKHPGLKVVDKSQVDQARAQVSGAGALPTRAGQIGRLAGAQLVISGEFQRFGDQLKVSAHVVKAGGGTIIDSAEVTGKITDIFALQDQVVKSIAGYLRKTVRSSPPPASAPAPSLSDRPLAAQPIPPAKPPVRNLAVSQEDEATRRLVQRRGSVETENEATKRLLQEKTAKGQSALEWYNRGVALNDNSDQEIEYYQKSLQVDPTFAKSYYNLGTVYYNRGRKAEAVEAYDKYLQYSADEEEKAKVRQFLSQVGDIGPVRGKPVGEREKRTALEMYNKGVELNDDSPQEIDYYRQALSYDPYLGKAHYNLGLLYYRKNMKPEALEHLKKYLEYSTDPSEDKEKITPIVDYLEKSTGSRPSVQPSPPPAQPSSPSPPSGGVREEPLP